MFDAIHRGNPDSKLLAYQYLQVLPQIAQSPANKVWIVPTELTQALRGIGNALGGSEDGRGTWTPGVPGADASGNGRPFAETQLEDPAVAVQRAEAEVAGAEGSVAESRIGDR